MDKQEIKDKLALRKQKVMVECKSTLEVVEILQVAKKGSDHFLPHMAVFKGKGCYVVYYDKTPPKGFHIETYGNGRGWYSVKVSDVVCDVIAEAIKSYKSNNYHTQPYSHLVAYCLGKGVDLIKEDIIQL